jgi:hypothetical protein
MEVAAEAKEAGAATVTLVQSAPHLADNEKRGRTPLKRLRDKLGARPLLHACMHNRRFPTAPAALAFWSNILNVLVQHLEAYYELSTNILHVSSLSFRTKVQADGAHGMHEQLLNGQHKR